MIRIMSSELFAHPHFRVKWLDSVFDFRHNFMLSQCYASLPSTYFGDERYFQKINRMP
jgi:hypothetical protein